MVCHWMERIVSATRAWRYHMVDHVARTRAARFVCAWAMIESWDAALALWLRCDGYATLSDTSACSTKYRSDAQCERIKARYTTL